MILKKALTLAFSKTAKNIYFVFSGNSLGLILAFVYIVLLVRFLSISDFGYYSAIFSFLLLVTDISDIGIGTSLSRFLPPLKHDKKRQDGFLKTAFFLQFGIALIVCFIMFVLSETIARFILHDLKFTYLVRVMCLGIVGSVLSNFFLQTLAAQEKFVFNSFSTIISGFFRLLFLIILIIFSQTYLTQVIWAQTLTYVAIVVIEIFLVGPEFLFAKRVKGDLKNLLSFTSFVGIARTLTAISGRLDVIMLMALRNNSVETGYYATASRITSMYPLFSGSFSTVIAPKLSAAVKRSDIHNFMKKVILVTIALIVSILILILISYPFITILFTMKAAPSVGVFRLLLVSMIFFVGSIPSVSIAIYYLKKPQILSVNAVLQLLIVFFGNLIFIPFYGRIGATYSLILAYGITLFLTSYISYKLYLKKG
jgi:O-antigen/teichoic acid export membrane protein